MALRYFRASLLRTGPVGFRRYRGWLSKCHALLVFILNDQVDYVRGLTLASGNAIGAWVGPKLVLERSDRFLRWLVAGTEVAFLARLLLS